MANEAVLLEKWRKIEGWPYSVSNHGNVRNDRNGKILKPTKNHDGYLKVNLCEKPRSVFRAVHILEAEAFLVKPFEGAVINHLDGNKSNNLITNLEYCSQQQNMEHSSVRHKEVKKNNLRNIRKDIENILNEGNITWQGKKDKLFDYVVSKINESKKK